jgi:predicted nucleic acid-binding protein
LAPERAELTGWSDGPAVVTRDTKDFERFAALEVIDAWA